MKISGMALTALLFCAAASISAVSISSAWAADRFPDIPRDKMTPAQQKVADYILKSRKNFSGPFNPWLRSAELADRFQSVGEYVRYKTAFSPADSEFAILIVARYWTSQLEWSIHYPIAQAAGDKKQMLDDIAANKRPAGMNDDQALIYDFGMAMQKDQGRIPDALFDKARAKWGDKKLVDLLGLNAYYAAAAMTINFGQVPLPAGVTPPLK